MYIATRYNLTVFLLFFIRKDIFFKKHRTSRSYSTTSELLVYIKYQFFVAFKLVFTARRVCLAWTMPWQDICLSVERRYSVKAVKHILKVFFTTILVFPYKRGWQYSDGDPPNGDVERKGYKIKKIL